MRLITENDLNGRTDFELAILFGMVAEALGRTKPGTPARRAIIASLQNISLARSAQHRQCLTPGF
jgi:hypothetical protein